MSLVPFSAIRNRFYRPNPFPGTLGRFNRRSATGRAARMRKFTATRFARTKPRMRSGQGVTEQYDAKVVYRKNRMPRRQRRRWKSFSRKVFAVSEKELGTQQVLFNVNPTILNTTSGNQLLFNCALYPMDSNTSYWNDLDQIGTWNSNAATTTSTGLQIQASSKVIFKSAVLDMTVRNSSSILSSGTPVFDPSAKLEVDVYEITVSRGDEEGVVYNDLLEMFAQNSGRTDPIGGGATEINLTTRGATPFELSYALSNFGIKVWKKTKYQLSNNEVFTYQMRDPRRHVLPQRELTSTEGPTKKGLTRCILIVARMAPGLTVGSVDGTYQERLDIGLTRKYTYKIENYTEDRTAYLNG